EDGKLSPSLVVKTPRIPENGWALQVEYDHLVELWNILGSGAAIRLPRPLGMATLHQQSALIISYVQGESLIRTSHKVLWENPRQVLALAVDAAQTIREIMNLTSTPIAEGEQVPWDFRQKVEKFKQMYALTEEENQINRLEVDRLKVSQKVLIQGDFWHGNMIREAHLGSLVLVDWQYSRWATDVSLDVYLFLLASALTSVPEKLMENKPQELVKILASWQSEIIPAYLSAFGKPAGFSLLPIRAGMLVCCVEKAVRASMDFGFIQADDLIWRLIFAELVKWPEESLFDDAFE
ncbi:MAG: phosphotransferase, partial [Chloroflexi bacterium]|nr:phosphotransferase [Chloroflexota bacterium]